MLKAIHDRCSGCRTCLLTCAIANQREVNPKKAALAIVGNFPSPGGYRIQVCDQCGQCADACPVEAIYEKSGVYIIDDMECTGCLSCVEACPNGVMMAAPNSPIPIKCTACGECVSICPKNALVRLSGSEETEAAG